MVTAHKYVIVIGFVGCVVSLAAFAVMNPSDSRVAFDNNGYPPNIGVQLWLDDAPDEGRLLRATCVADSCESEPIRIPKGRHRLRVRVLVGEQWSPFAVTTIER